MSRRDSRATSGPRQNDALHDFEQFKKKFLLANKHITKLNSSLSNRCQELEAIVSNLNTENLRLHATMISLHAELKRERDKSAKLMADVETLTMHALMKTFNSLRKTYDIQVIKSSPSERSKRSPPRVRRPDPGPSPHSNRLAQPPDFPKIVEEDEEREEDPFMSPTPPHRRKKSTRSTPPSSSSSTAISPYSANTPSEPSPVPPAIVASIQVDVNEALLYPSASSTKKRVSRRQSGLIIPVPTVNHSTLSPGRPPSPAFGSPLRRAAGLAEEEEELVVASGRDPEFDVEEQLIRAAAAKKEKRRRTKASSSTSPETGEDSGSSSARAVERDRGVRDREKRRSRYEDERAGETQPKKPSLKDVTNAPFGRGSLPPLEIPLAIPNRNHAPEDSDIPSSAFTTSTRPPLTTPGTTPAPSHLPTPRTSTPPPIPDQDLEPPALGGRERRARKSVNYAEPKLNTKMRKPDPPLVPPKRLSSTPVPRPSTSADAGKLYEPPSETMKRKRSRSKMLLDDPDDEDEDNDDGAQADEEYIPSRSWVNVSRRRSTQAGTGRRSAIDGDERRHSSAL